jgi:hypothetical protein
MLMVSRPSQPGGMRMSMKARAIGAPWRALDQAHALRALLGEM